MSILAVLFINLILFLFRRFITPRLLQWFQKLAIQIIREELDETENTGRPLPDQAKYPESAEEAADFLTGPAMDIVKRYLRLNSRISFCSLSLGILLFLWGFALAIDLTMREPTMLIMFITVPFAGLPILFNVGILLDTRKDIKKIDEIIIDLENKYNMLAARACVEMYNEIMQRVHGGTSKGQESATVLKSRLFDESYQSSQS